MSAVENVDAEEIAKFDAMASRWWDTEGDFKPLHQMNPVRANYIDTHSPVAEKKTLDVGCGGGLLTEAMAQRGAHVTGIDMGENPLSVAKLHAKENQLKINYQNATAEMFAQSHAKQFDVVSCLEMLEHVPDPAAVVNACAQLVKPEGHVYFSTLNRNPKSYAMAIVGAEYVLRWLPKGTHDYKKFIKPSELAQWCRAAHLSVVDIVGIVYHPLTQRFTISDSDVDVNYIVRANPL